MQTIVTKKMTLLERLKVSSVEEALSKILKLKNFNIVKEVYLFGSCATESFNCDSDIDLIFIIDSLKASQIPFLERPLLFDDISSLPVPVDLLVYSREEFDSFLINESDLFWKNIKRTMKKIL